MSKDLLLAALEKQKNSVQAIIEMPKGTRYKYEIKENQLLIDRVLQIPVPSNYGFIPDTLAPDGDPLDIFVVDNEPMAVGALVTVSPKALVVCNDNGESDNKIISCLLNGDTKDWEVESFTEKLINYLKSYKKGFVVQELTFDLQKVYDEINKYKN